MPDLIEPIDLYTAPLPTTADYDTGVLSTATDQYAAIPTAPSTTGEAYDVVDPTALRTVPSAYEAVSTAPSDISGFSQYTPPPTTALGEVKAGSTYQTPESTVSGQLATLLQSGSPLMRQAEERAKEQANKLGLLSSSMAVGAGQGALISQALPIAQQDAATAAARQTAQQAAEYAQSGMQTEATLSGARSVQNAQLAQQQKDLDQNYNTAMTQAQTEEERNKITSEYQFQTAIKKADVTTQAAAQSASDAFTAAMAKADKDTVGALAAMETRWADVGKISYASTIQQFELQMQNNEISDARYSASINSTNQITQNTQSVIAQILNNPDLMTPEAIPGTTAMINTLIDQSVASMDFISSLSGVNQGDYSALLAAYNASMQF